MKRLSGHISVRHLVVVVVAATLASAGAVLPAAADTVGRTVTRDGHDVSVRFRTRSAGAVLLDLTASAPGVSWQTDGAESAVLRLSVGGIHVTDSVVMSESPITRSFDLGTLPAGRHVLLLHFDADASAPSAEAVYVRRARFRTVAVGTRDYVALAHSPVLYGRTGPTSNPRASGPYQNAVTDTPLIAWHEATAAPVAGHRRLRYSIVWSNEDGGTSTPALMARWGRTTDIEWVYQVDVDALGHTVPGTAVFQAPAHVTAPFAGTYEGERPLLQTCTLNNNVCDDVNATLRFSLSTASTFDTKTQAREEFMDANPWTYRVMAEEVRREGKVVAAPDPAQTLLIADPSDYLYVVVRKQTLGAPNNGLFWVGLAIGVRLEGDPTLYRSDAGVHRDWSLQRDEPAATTVRLPPGTRASDIEEIDAIRVAFGPDTGASIRVDAINRAFLLGAHDRPKPSFLSGPTPANLTATAPTAILYQRNG